MVLYRALPTGDRESIGPFVFLDHYRHQSRRGIGDRPHPHAGIEVLSYLLDGGVEHRDSAGFRDELGPGDAQWIRAGRGIIHAEQPTGGRHGLQLWTSLPSAERLSEPAYESFRADEIPHVELPGATIDVVAGRVAGAEGPVPMTSATTFAVVHLDPGATVRFDVDPDAELGVYVAQGAVVNAPAPIGAGMVAMLEPGSTVMLEAADDGRQTIVAVLGGAPIREPIYFSGAFVMDSPELLAQAQEDFASGRMGTLEGVPF